MKKGKVSVIVCIGNYTEKWVNLYFSGVRGVERYEHASLAASLKNVNAKKTIIILFVVTLCCYLITN